MKTTLKVKLRKLLRRSQRAERLGGTLCDQCGYYFLSIGSHMSKEHGVSPREYKSMLGMNMKESLLCEYSRNNFSNDRRCRELSPNFVAVQKVYCGRNKKNSYISQKERDKRKKIMAYARSCRGIINE